MIIELLLILFRDMLLTVIGVLPNSTVLPVGITNAFSIFTEYFSMADRLFPVSTLFQIIGVGLSFEASIMLFKIINFAIKKLRGSG